MNRSFTSACLGIFAICMLSFFQSHAEGSKQLSPIVAPGDTSIVMLHTNADSTGNFAEYNGSVVSRMNIRIEDFNSDTLYIGLSREYDDFGNPDGIGGVGTFCFRIKDPNGNVVHGPFSINSGNANADSWLLATSGPDVLDPVNGYDTQTEPYAMFLPAMNGDYYIEFTDNPTNCGTANPGNQVNLKYFDFTVVSGGEEQTGRLWSLNWAFVSPPINPNMPPECQFDRPFNGVLFSYTTDGFVSKIDFDSSGFQGLQFTVAFGDRGPSNMGDVILDRMSVNNADSTANAAVHMVFINEPDLEEFPSSTDVCGEIELFSVDCVADTFCFSVGITQPGQIEIILDFSGDGVFTDDTNDVILAVILDIADTVCIGWNGLKGDGTPLGFGDELPAIIRYSQGVQHYAAYDVELLKFGFCVETVRPICPGISTDLLYWDDSNISDDVNTPLYDESDPGTGQPAMQLNGCTCQTNLCRTWTNVHIDSDTTCVGQITGYGDQNTLNTWWFASTTILGPLDLPFVSGTIMGDSTICFGETGEFIAVGSPDTLDFIFAWLGPNGFMASTAATGPISDPGLYSVTITDTVSNCSFADQITLVVSAVPELTLSFTCNAENQANADIDLTVVGNGPFTFLWSNMETTEDLMDVPPGTYIVTVTDVNLCEAIDSITVEGCCTLDVVCPSPVGGQFACIDDVPAPDTTLIIVNDYCDPLQISSIDVELSGEASGCSGDTIIIQRTYTITDGADSTVMCVQIFRVVDDIAPFLQCPADITVDCDGGIDTALTGVPTVSDNCSDEGDLTVTYVDIGLPGNCIEDAPVSRMWTVTDACGNSATCIQLIFVQDTVAPEVVPASCPADITVNCDNGKFGLGAPDFTDNCTDGQSLILSSREDSTGFDGTCVNNIVGTVTITFFAEDLCGNIDSSCAVSIFVQDTVAPTFTTPGDVTADCNGDISPAFTGEVLDTTDNCTAITLMFEDTVVPADCPAQDSIYRTWTATDACGNSSTGVQIIVTFDFTAPTFTVPMDVTIDCSADTDPTNTGEILDTFDLCGSAITVDYNDVVIVGLCDGESLIFRGWVVSDECGNSANGTQTITLIDTIGPTFEIPADATVDCPVTLGDFGVPGLVTDNCSAITNATFVDEVVPGECPATDTLYRTWIVSDGCGNTTVGIQTVVFIDTIAPAVLSCPEDVTFDCAAPADTLGLPTYLDACSEVEITFRDDSVGFMPPAGLGMILRTFFGTDACGNVDSSCIQTIVLQDTVAPVVLTCPANITIECPTLADTSITGVPTYSDNCFDVADLTLTFIDDTVGVGGLCSDQTITRRFYISDPEGNVDSSCVQVINAVDDTPPTFTVPAAITVECTVDLDDLTILGNVSDVLDCNVLIDTAYVTTDPTGCNGTGLVIRTWTVTDACGNSASADQNITIQDTGAPTFTVPANVTISCDDDPTDLALTGDVTDEGDACGTATVGFVDNNAGLTGCNGTGNIVRTWTATDGCGNTSSQQQTIAVVDDAPPVAVCADITIDFGIVDVYVLTPEEVDGGSSDNCGDVTLSLSQTEFACTEFTEGQTIVIQLTVTDECGLTDVCDVQVTGIGGGGLVIDCPNDIVINLGNFECEGIVDYVVTASSLCGGPGNVITIEQVDNSGLTSGDYFPIGVTIQEYIAFNTAGDTVSCSFTITVIEGPEVPFVNCNDTVTISLDQNCEAIINPDIILEGGIYGCFEDFYICVAGIGCDSGQVLISNPELGCYSVTVTSESGASCWGVVCFEDKLPPQITCTDVTLNCGASTDPVFTPVQEGTVTASASPASAIGPDAGAVTTQALQINAPPAAQVTDINITIDLDHTWSDDLDVFLIAPNGAQVEIATDVCGANDNWDNVTFDDEAPVLVTAACVGGNPTLSGSVQPEGFLSDFDGLDASGEWTLQITDDAGGDAGTLNFFSIDIAYFVALPYAPSASDACSEVTLSYTETESGELCENVIITRTWTATDESGNTAQCVQTLTIVPLTLAGLEFPPTYIGTCGLSSHPDNTGWPTLDGIEIDGGFVCNIFLTWEDHPLADCGGGNKIIRTWTVLDWCTLEIVEGEQIIKLTDDQAPVLECPADVTVGSDPWFCYGNVILEVPSAVDLCGTPFTLTPSVNAGILVHFGGSFYRVDQLPVGTHTITWTAEDACGNESTCSYDVTVIDDVPPVPLCDEHTVLTLTNDNGLNEGLTKLYATTLDDGSYDNCGPVTFLARRMDSCIDFDWIGPNGEYPNNDGGQPESIDRGLTFQEWVPFACCDAGQTIMVELRVTDLSGNINSCMVEVYVQDKLPPLIVCPPDITVSCEYWFDAQETDGFQPVDGLEGHFGRVLDAYDYSESDRQAIIIDDPGNHQLPQPYNWGLDGWADDNCDVTIDVRTRLFDDCSGTDLPGGGPDYAVRLVERTFRAQDQQGNTSTCRQRIWVVDFDPFFITDTQCGLNNADDVRWPCDLELTECPEGYLTPESLSAYAPNNRPIVNDDNCSVIGVTYEDQVFYFIDGACYKIVRTWTVIDWCQFEDDGEGGHHGYWQYVQVIKVNDHIGAEFLDCPAGPITLCVEDEGITLPSNNQVFLGEDNPNSSACSVHVLSTRTVFESCSDAVIYDVKVYPFNGVDFVQVHAPTTVSVDSNNQAILTFNTEQNSLPSNHPIRRYGLPYNDRFCSNYPLPGGTKDYHRILWTVEDGCGNISTCSYLFRLEDCKQPTPICVGLSSVVMPTSGSVTIWAADFDSGSSVDDCTAHEDLLFSFSGDTYQPSQEFDCDAIETNGSSTFILEIWVADEGNDQNCDGVISYDERNKDFCTTFIVIDDNEEVCPGGVGVAGLIETELHETVELVTVQMRDANGQIMGTVITDEDGEYQFGNPLLTYSVIASRNDNHKNGVSTLDLVEIQKHLLGIKHLDSPYKMIAADANNSESVSALDLVDIRKLILGLYTEYPRNTSWRFVDADFEFESPVSPWPFAEVIDLESGMTLDENFIAMKIGDVNGSVVANATQVQTRGARPVLQFQIEDRSVKAGEIVEIAVHGSEFSDILGFQLTMETTSLEYVGVQSGAIEMLPDYVAEHQKAITMSFGNVQPVTTGDQDALFVLSFRAKESGSLSSMLNVSSAITDAEAYRSVADGVELLDIALTFDQIARPALEYALYQNEPNPFEGQTVIGFDLPAAMDATLTVYDMHGRVVHKIEASYAQGYNEIVLKGKELKVTGAYYYRLNAGDFTASKKLIMSQE